MRENRTNGVAARVSIGMPVYNEQRFLAQTLDSILDQTFDDFELIISDNASTDQTEKICRAYAACDARIRYYRCCKNRGAAWNYRHVVRLANGEYFRWAPGNDPWHCDLLKECVDVLAQEPDTVLVYPQSTLIDESGVVLKTTSQPPLPLHSNDIATRFQALLSPIPLNQTVALGLVRKSVLLRTRMIGNYLAADRCFLAELSLHGPFAEVAKPLFYRRVHSGNVGTSKKDLEFYDPSLTSRFVFPEWRVLREHICSIQRTPLPTQMKLRLVRTVLSWAVVARRQVLLKQLAIPFRDALIQSMKYRKRGTI
ncbi:MAG: glycosyltransferase family A protein [Pirellulaceae bacterium]